MTKKFLLAIIILSGLSIATGVFAATSPQGCETDTMKNGELCSWVDGGKSWCGGNTYTCAVEPTGSCPANPLNGTYAFGCNTCSCVLTCDGGYTNCSGTCVANCTAGSNCASCDTCSSNSCTSCDAGYDLVGSTCVSAPLKISNLSNVAGFIKQVTTPSLTLDGSGNLAPIGDLQLLNNKSIALTGVGTTSLWFGNYNGATPFAYGTGDVVSLGIEGDLKANRLCFQDDCRSDWASVGGGSATWTRSGTNIFPTTLTDNVGIGISNPGARLEVAGNIFMQGTLLGRLATDNNWRIGYNPATSPLTRALVTSNSWQFISSADVSQGFAFGPSGGNAIFELNSNNATAYFRGNVGIGTTTPNLPLHISANSGSLAMSLKTSAGYNSLSFRDELNVEKGFINYFGTGYVAQPSRTNRFEFASNGAIPIAFVVNNNYTAPALYLKSDGNVGVGTTVPNDTFSIGNSGSAPAGSSNTGHNYTSTYLSTDDYALTNYGIVKTLIGNATSSLPSGANFWGGTLNGNIWNGDAGVGNVGIGTTAPGYPLDVQAAGSVARFTSNSYVNPVIVRNNTTGLYATTAIGFQNAAGTTVFQAGAAGSTYSNSAYPALTANGSFLYTTGNFGMVSDNASGRFDFQIGQNAAGVKMSILASGNVGIGMTNPLDKLDVAGNIRMANIGSSGNGIYAYNSTPTLLYSLTRQDTITGAGDLAIGSYRGIGFKGSQALPTSYDMYIYGGNVGIGTTNPGSKLVLDLDGSGKTLSFYEWAGAGTYSTYGWGIAGSVDKLKLPSTVYFGDSSFYFQKSGLNGLFAVYDNFDIQTYNGSYGSRFRVSKNGNVGIGITAPNDIFSIGNSGSSAPAGSSNTGHNYTSTYLSTDDYALANYGIVKTLIASATSSLPTAVNFWGGTKNGTIYNGDAGAGNVGIGTTNPAYALEVEASSSLSRFTKIITSGSPALYTGHTLLLKTTAVATDGLGIGNFFALDENGGGSNYLGYFGAVKSGASNSGSLIFGVYNSGASAEKMRINNFGNVGIGLTNPDSPLHIIGSAQPLLHIQNSNGNSGITAGILFGVTGAIGDYQQAGIFFERLGGAAEGSLHFATKNGGAGNATKADARMTITAGGNIGIGTTTPAYKLTVVGTSYLNGQISTSLSGAGNRCLYVDATGNVSAKSVDCGTATGGDNLGDHTATQNILLGNYWLSGDGANEGVFVNSTGNVGIGLSTPGVKLDVAGPANGGGLNLRTIGDVMVGTSAGSTIFFDGNYSYASGNYIRSISANVQGFYTAGAERIRVTAAGNVGIGTTAPNDTFSIGNSGTAPAGSSNTGHNYTSTYLSTDNYALANYGIVRTLIAAATSTMPNGSYLPLAGGTMTGDVNFGAKNITNLNNLTVSKITATTIDPLYNINGINYSTFAPSVVGGVKEELVGKADIKRFNNKLDEYEYIINFSLEDEGSDLWVWRKVVDYSDDNVLVFVTPSGKFADVYYKIENNKLIFRSDKPVEVSYRLIGNRHDWKAWPTKAKDQEQTGVIIK